MTLRSNRAASCLGRYLFILAATLTWSAFASALPIDWIAGVDDWFDPANWSPAQVPTSIDDVSVNNGGTAEATGVAELTAASLRLGVDGGSGALIIEPPTSIDPLVLDGPLLIGVTTTGTAKSTGSLTLRGPFVSDYLRSTTPSPFRLGATDSDGDADGTLIATDGGSGDGVFSTVEIGVSAGAGEAVAVFEGLDPLGLPDGFQIGGAPTVEIGVAKAGGDATARVSVLGLADVDALAVGRSTGSGEAHAEVYIDRGFDPRWRAVEVGVASADGPATGSLTNLREFEGDGSGNLDIGVSLGSAPANGLVTNRRGLFASQTVKDYADVRVGVSGGAGDATGSLLSLSGVGAERLIIGTHAGGGVGTGTLRQERGASQLTTLTMGPGATLQVGVKGPVKGGASAGPSGYATIDADNVELDPAASLIVELAYVPETAQTFELIESATVDGIAGDFGTVEVRHLNQGYVATPGLVVDGGVEKYVLDLTGTAREPVWNSPGVGDWFDSSNWSSPATPGTGDRSSINNGGEAVASSATTSDPMEVFFLSVGEDGGSGALTVEGLTVTPLKGMTIGKVSEDHLLGGTTSGTASFVDVDYIPPQVYEVDRGAASQSTVEPALGVGLAAGDGLAEGSLTIEGGSVIVPDEPLRTRDTSRLMVGVAMTLDGDRNPSAIGHLELNPGGGQTQLHVGELRIGWAEIAGGGPVSAEAMASAVIRNTEIRGIQNVATALCSSPMGMASTTLKASSFSGSAMLDRKLNLGDVRRRRSRLSGA